MGMSEAVMIGLWLASGALAWWLNVRYVHREIDALALLVVLPISLSAGPLLLVFDIGHFVVLRFQGWKITFKDEDKL